MKKFILLILLLPLFLSGCNRKTDDKPTDRLVIYTYDSFVSEWGPAPQLIPLFEEKYGVTPEFVSAGDAGQVVQKLIVEKDKPKADLVIGIDSSMLNDVLEQDLLESCKPENISKIPSELFFDKSSTLIPYDYGYFSIIYDSEKLDGIPQSLEDLTKEKYSDSLILMDPRTSSPGLGFFLWTVAVYGDDFGDYWERLMPSVLTVSDGWSGGYGLFTNGEAPMVLSYTTSPAYHVEYESSNRYKAAMFEQGHFIQIEGMAVVKNAANRKNAVSFIEFMLSKEAQEIIPLTNWMYPVNQEAELPASFSAAPKADKNLSANKKLSAKELEEMIDKWVRIVSK